MIGFSTGTLRRWGIGIDEAIKKISKAGSNIIELSFRSPHELFDFKLEKEIMNYLSKFAYVSLHAPWREVSYKKTDEILNRLVYLHKKIKSRVIIFHPQIIQDFSLITGLPIGVENMDERKPFGKTAQEMEKIFNEHDFGFVLDINHAFRVDKTMANIKEIIYLFRDRIVEVHASDYINKVDSHVPFCLTGKGKMLKPIKTLSCPIILEGRVPLGKEEYLKMEIDFVSKKMRKFVNGPDRI